MFFSSGVHVLKVVGEGRVLHLVLLPIFTAFLFPSLQYLIKNMSLVCPTEWMFKYDLLLLQLGLLEVVKQARRSKSIFEVYCMTV